MFVNQLLNGIFQVVLFSVVPLAWWAVTARKEAGFFSWLGLKRPEYEDRKHFWLTVIAVFFVCWVTGELAIWIRGDLAAADSAYKGMGAAAIPSVLAYSYIQTGLSEEILFRGFLLKRMMAKFGFFAATAVQAVIFGAVHLTMVWGRAGVIASIVIVVYPMIPAVLLAYMNEKKAGGSILAGWLIHGTLNTVTALSGLF